MTSAGPTDRPGSSAAEPALPRSGDVLHVTREASVQFRTPIYFRVIRVLDWPTYAGWIWLDGYQLNDAGEATARRSIFVQITGLRRLPAAPGQGMAGRTGRSGRTGARRPGGSPPSKSPPAAPPR